MYYLITHTGKIEIQEGVTTIGRTAKNDLVLNETTVSRHHAELELNGDKLLIRDLGSTNGTIVNSKKISTHELQPDDIIEIGGRKMVVTLISDIAQENVVEVDSEQEIAFEVNVTNIRSGLKDIDDEFEKIIATRGKSTEKRSIEILKQDLQKEVEYTNQKKLAILLEVSRALNAVQDVRELLELVMDLLFTIFEPDGVVLALFDETSQKLKPEITRWRIAQDLQDQKIRFSRSIAQKVYETGNAVIAADAVSDEQWSSDSVITQNIRSVVCVPLTTRERSIGVIYIDHRLASGIYDEEDLKFIAAFGSTVAVAIERSQLQNKLQSEQFIRTNLERYLSPSIVDSIVSNPHAVELGSTRRVVTSVFVDIRDFTSIAAGMDPDRIIAMLNEFFQDLVQIVFKYEGTLDKYLGDGLLAVWGAPFSHKNDAFKAVQASVDMLQAAEQLNRQWQNKYEDHQPLHIGIGISTGPVLAGNIGTQKRMEYTIIGDDVNLASRLCQVAGPGEILISENTRELVKSQLRTKMLPPVQVKGKTKPTPVYSVEI